MRIFRGEAFPLPFQLSNNGTVITASAVTEVEVKIADINKKYSEGDVTYNSTTQIWTVNLSAAETKTLENQNYTIYAWATFVGDTEHIRAVPLDSISVKEAE